MKNDASVEKVNIILTLKLHKQNGVNTVPKVIIKFMIVKMT